MKFTETELPGIGKKYSVITNEKNKISVIVHFSGRREIYYFDKADYDEPVCTISMNEEEAKQVGSVLMGTYFKPPEEDAKEILFKNLVMEWIKIDKDSIMKDKTIKDLQIRKLTGASIIVILRGDISIVNPSPDEVIKEGDTLIVVGDKKQMEKFFEIFYPACKLK